MRTAAKLGGEVANLDHAHLVAVLFAEQSHRMVLVHGHVDRHILQRDHLGVRENIFVDAVFYVLQLFLGDGGEMREVEAQVSRVVQ